ncbi:Fic family protein [uncultured Clostridium sp.]|uniref:Fic family protein n=1 Tax=uncultured Clostridium sp. TaxID=59620 RepID=UPI0025FD8AAD|nr:Fic family protein [uncultured Clostridium sp.]
MAKQEYEIYAETPDKKKKKEYWETAIGLQQVDALEPSEYLIDLAQQNIDGKLTYQQVEELLYTHYEDESGAEKEQRLKEGDLVASRITQILDSPGYPLQLASLKAIHRYLFKDLYEHAGEFRRYNIYKKEPVLNGESVKYTNYGALVDTLEYDIRQEKETTYAGLKQEQIVNRIARFTSALWQAHPFMEGNTRTTAVFMECYLNSIGFRVDNTPFKRHSLYFRNALVRANYADYSKGIIADSRYLELFFCNLLTDKKTPLRNRDLLLIELFEGKDTGAGRDK